MTRDEFVRRSVLDKICDDYENVDQTILVEVARDGAQLGLTLERSDMVSALASLVADGLAKGYDLPGGIEFEGMPPLDIVEENFKTYFLATKKGLDLQLSDDSWWPYQRDQE